jgi:hypothetical protein
VRPSRIRHLSGMLATVVSMARAASEGSPDVALEGIWRGECALPGAVVASDLGFVARCPGGPYPFPCLMLDGLHLECGAPREGCRDVTSVVELQGEPSGFSEARFYDRNSDYTEVGHLHGFRADQDPFGDQLHPVLLEHDFMSPAQQHEPSMACLEVCNHEATQEPSDWATRRIWSSRRSGETPHDHSRRRWHPDPHNAPQRIFGPCHPSAAVLGALGALGARSGAGGSFVAFLRASSHT